MSDAAPLAPPRLSPDWELDYYSRPIVEADGRKRWELLICSSPDAATGARSEPFRWVCSCPASSVNSAWLRQALQEALAAAAEQGFGAPRRVRCWRASMRTMVQRAAEGLGLELVPSRRCYSLVEWLREREATVYPAEEGYLQGPLAPLPSPIRPIPVPLPEAARGDRWGWVTLPAGALADAPDWDTGFAALLPLPEGIAADTPVTGLRLISRTRALPIAGWVAGLEPVRLEIEGDQLVLEAGLEDRWRIASLSGDEAAAAAAAFAMAREQAAGLQFLVVQASDDTPRLEGFWMLRDLPDG